MNYYISSHYINVYICNKLADVAFVDLLLGFEFDNYLRSLSALKIRVFVSLLVLFCFFSTAYSQRKVSLRGVVRDDDGRVMEMVHVNVLKGKLGTATKADGSFELLVDEGAVIDLEFSFVGFTSVRKQIKVRAELPLVQVQMQSEDTELGSVTVSKASEKEPVGVRLNPKLVSLLPGSSLSGIEATIKTLPGVATTSELSSQYNVRGGNFDENLTYVNGMQVYKPLLIRSGQQEGFSFVNSDLVSGINFSSGGFGVEYADKMSSVLDIRYRQPRNFAAGASASLMGGAAHVEGYSSPLKLSHITGFRYKNNSLVVGTLDEKGEYHPQFLDLQTSIVWRPNDFWTFNALGYLSRNSYSFTPQSKQTVFGDQTRSLSLYVAFEGREVDYFDTYYAAFISTYRPNEDLKLMFNAANNYSNESETYDILSAYRLDDASVDSTQSHFADSSKSIASGGSLRHARNYLRSNITDFQHSGQLKVENHLFRWGAGAQVYRVDYNIDEWTYVDSAGYALPVSDSGAGLQSVMRNAIRYNASNCNVSLQDDIKVLDGDLVVTPGIRCGYYPTSSEVLTSPRVRLIFNPHWNNGMMFRFSSGLYYQPTFFKELLSVSGMMYNEVKAQRALHYVAGMDMNLRIWSRPFKFTAECYYKDLQRIIPYTVENVKIQYRPDQSASGYATGLDMKLNGEFVKGTESWASLSIMQTHEKIDGSNSGWLRRPADQLINLGVFFQDYLPFDNSYKMQLAMYYGSDLPTWNPSKERRASNTNEIPSYQRVDIGFSKQIFPTKQNPDRSQKTLKNLWVWFEVFNLLDIRNRISYTWVPDISQKKYYGVPNYLTARMVNIKISASF